MVTDFLSFLATCLLLYGFVRLVLSKRKRKARTLLRKMADDKAMIRQHLSDGKPLTELEDLRFKQPI